MSNQILALFDFCETLTNFQTLDRFLLLAQTHNPNYRKTTHNVRYGALVDFPIVDANALAKEFVYDEIIPNLNQKIIDKLFEYQDLGHTICIVSGGLEIYIKEFAKIYDIKNVVAVELEEKNSKLTGNIRGIHTMQERKLYKLAQMVNLDEFNLGESCAYSDCVSDIPLLSLVGNGYVVQSGKDLKWARLLNFKII